MESRQLIFTRDSEPAKDVDSPTSNLTLRLVDKTSCQYVQRPPKMQTIPKITAQ